MIFCKYCSNRVRGGGVVGEGVRGRGWVGVGVGIYLKPEMSKWAAPATLLQSKWRLFKTGERTVSDPPPLNPGSAPYEAEITSQL